MISLLFIMTFAAAEIPAEISLRQKCLSALGQFEFGDNPNVPLSWKGEKFPPFINITHDGQYYAWTGRKIYRTKRLADFVYSEATLRLNYHSEEVTEPDKALIDKFLQPSFDRLINAHVTASTAKHLTQYMKSCEDLKIKSERTGRPIAEQALERRTQLEKLYHFGDAAKEESIYQNGDQ